MNVRELYASIKGVQHLVETERDTQSDLSEPLRRRLWLWRRGFLTQSGVLYGLEESNYREYVTDYQRFVRTKRINGTWSVALSNKLAFHWLLQPFDDHRMTVYGMLRDGSFHGIDSLQPPQAIGDGGTRTRTRTRTQNQAPNRTHRDGPDWVVDRLEDEKRLVLKWVQGGGGNNVLLCSRVDGGYRVNGEHLSEAAFRSRLADLEEYLVCEFVEQGWFPAELYPETPNTIRIVTMYDRAAGEPFVAAAIQRMGTADSEPMDNFSQGGLTAEIDVETGALGPGAQLPYDGDLEWHAAHPDTGTRIEGAQIPGWSTAVSRILELAETYSYIPYIGWDVVVTGPDGEFKILEGNSYPGLKSIQVHGPLLTDDRVRRFYERHGVC
ncbi:sugar-transfer associated ATP-grasp domain-containing protein [Halomontanus rarus]|uniref:sugar-transfer associated ATP-grasp domain-containing protein n=1 Tax=Halomontanus rarus TaxID=3034020 RepID=UPI0023E760C1|nr:sugar-transfer associated ATP-grasp domain-containing protein [Halovivax sp. TS33]